jgi:hypothetical protein
VRNRILESPFRWLYQIEESYSNETNSNVPAVGNAVSGSVKSDTTIPADAAGEKLLANKILDVSTDKAH